MNTGRPLLSLTSVAILMMLGAYLLFTFADSTTKWLVMAASMPALQIAFMRYGVHLLICSVEVSVRGIHPGEIRDHLALLMLRGAMLSTATAANFYALKYLTLSMYSAIMFSAPIFVSLLSWPVLGERVGPWRWTAIVCGFIGVLIIIRPFDSTFHPAALVSLYAAIAVAVYSTVTRKLAHRVRSHVMQFFTGAFGVVILLPFAVWLWQPVDSRILLLVAWVGLVSWGGHELLTRAHKLAEAS
ncbi:MAG: DMT family transporter, partial [Thiolinea sp.]